MVTDPWKMTLLKLVENLLHYDDIFVVKKLID